MNISKITPYNFKGETTPQIQPKEKHLTDNFQTKLKNSYNQHKANKLVVYN